MLAIIEAQERRIFVGLKKMSICNHMKVNIL